MLLSFAAAAYAQEVIVNGHMFTPLDAWTKWGDHVSGLIRGDVAEAA